MVMGNRIHVGRLCTINGISDAVFKVDYWYTDPNRGSVVVVTGEDVGGKLLCSIDPDGKLLVERKDITLIKEHGDTLWN
jgi:hypothetical protein